jgi:hypothetical protein
VPVRAVARVKIKRSLPGWAGFFLTIGRFPLRSACRQSHSSALRWPAPGGHLLPGSGQPRQARQAHSLDRSAEASATGEAMCLPILFDTDGVWRFDRRMGARQVDESEPERRSLQGPCFGDPVGRRTGNRGVAVGFPNFNCRRTITPHTRIAKPQPASLISNPLCLWPTNGARVFPRFWSRRNLLPWAVAGPGPCTDQAGPTILPGSGPLSVCGGT